MWYRGNIRVRSIAKRMTMVVKLLFLSRARAAAWTSDNSWSVYTSHKMSGTSMKTKQLRRNGVYKPIIQLGRVSNCKRYSLTKLYWVNLNRVPVGSSYCDGAKRASKS